MIFIIEKIYVYFRVLKEAGCAEDQEGNPAETYLKFSISLRHPITEENREAFLNDLDQKALKDAVAQRTGIDSKFLDCITHQEYMSNILNVSGSGGFGL